VKKNDRGVQTNGKTRGIYERFTSQIKRKLMKKAQGGPEKRQEAGAGAQGKKGLVKRGGANGGDAGTLLEKGPIPRGAKWAAGGEAKKLRRIITERGLQPRGL